MEAAMSKKMLQIEFTFAVPLAEVAPMFQEVAKAIKDVPGLTWKIWLYDEKEKKGGGVYLFDDEASRDAYLEGPIVGQLRSHPAFRDVVARRFDVIDELSAMTRGPTR